MATFSTTYLPLARSCRWLRGNHHGHSTVSDGTDDPLTNVRVYEAAGYDYLALSEHDMLLDPSELQARTRMCLLPAVEVTSASGQTLMVLGSTADPPPRRACTAAQIMAHAQAAGALFIVDHPNWLYRPGRLHIGDDELEGLSVLRGMEIYTGVIERLAGSAQATDRWDRLLARGSRVFGHATDDQHAPDDRFIAWNCVQWPDDQDPTAPGVLEALSNGRFYPSTGVAIERLGVSDGGDQIVIESDADAIHWIGTGGIIVHKSTGGSARFAVDDLSDCPFAPRREDGQVDLAKLLYLRAECFGRGSARAWTQPFWLVTD